MVLSIGEILVDVFDTDGKKMVKPGGAPFNVASNIAHFGGKSSFYGAVGADDYGRFLIDFASQKPFFQLIIKQRPKRATTVALVTLHQGERDFKFLREQGADYLFNLDDLAQFSIDSQTIIHLGSLMLATPEGSDFFEKALQWIKRHQLTLSFDLNFREDLFGPLAKNRDKFVQAIHAAKILKFSEEELLLFSGKDTIEEALSSIDFSEKIVFVTLGSQGSIFSYKGTVSKVKTIQVTPIDTTGAGDAFYAHVLYGIDQIGLDHLDVTQLEKITYRANITGALSTLKYGAIDVVPTLEEIKRYENE